MAIRLVDVAVAAGVGVVDEGLETLAKDIKVAGIPAVHLGRFTIAGGSLAASYLGVKEGETAFYASIPLVVKSVASLLRPRPRVAEMVPKVVLTPTLAPTPTPTPPPAPGIKIAAIQPTVTVRPTVTPTPTTAEAGYPLMT